MPEVLLAAAARLVPEPCRERVFEPALADLRVEQRARSRRDRRWFGRAVLTVWFHVRALQLARECRALAHIDRRRAFPDAPRPSFFLRGFSMADLTFALRTLRKAPGFTLAAVLAMALGIGANTAIFTVVKQVLLQPLPYPAAHRLVAVDELKRGQSSAVSAPNFMDWRARNRTLSGIGAYNEQTLTLSSGPEPMRLDGAAIDAGVLPALDVQPLLGRGVTEADARPGARPVVLVGNVVWQRVFGGDRSLVGRSITLEGEPYEVIGVMPPGFDFPGGCALWVPLTLTPHALGDSQRGAHYLGAVGRLRDGVTVAQAAGDLDGIEQDIARRFPNKVAGYTIGVEPLLQSMVGEVERPLWILFGAVGFVLLIACVNVSNLLLARGTARTGEIAVRSALGAGRGRLVRQLMVESVVLSLTGGAAGVLLGFWGVRYLMTAVPGSLPRAAAVHMDAAVLAFSFGLSVLAGVLFGTVPALVGSRPNLAIFLRDVRRDGGSAGGGRRVRELLVGAQVALALVLLAGAGLAGRSFLQLTSVDPGFRTNHVLSFEIALPDATYPSMARITTFFRDYVEAVSHAPGVTAAGAVSFAPLTADGFGGSFDVIGRPADADEASAQIRSITPGYAEALAIPLKAGRLFDARDSAASAKVAIISEATARRYWPNESPVGKQLRLHVNEPTRVIREVVGVVGDIHLHRLDLAPAPVIYVPHTQYGPEFMTIVARTTGDPMQALPAMKTALRTIGPGVAMGSAKTFDQVVAASVAQPRFRTMLLLIFAAVSLGLASVGLYGVVAFSVNQRRSELGLRMALGADRSRVFRLVLIEGMMPVFGGILAGMAGALLLARLMRTLLYEVQAFDPLTFAGVALVLAAVALAACYIPARRATRLDPVTALR